MNKNKKVLVIVLLVLGSLIGMALLFYYMMLYPFTEEHEIRVAEKFYKKNQEKFLDVQEWLLNIPEPEIRYSRIYVCFADNNIEYKFYDEYEIILSETLSMDEVECVQELWSQIDTDTRGVLTDISYSENEQCFDFIFAAGGRLKVSVDGTQFSFRGLIHD